MNFFVPILFVSVFNSKGKTKRGSYLKNLNWDVFTVFSLIQIRASILKQGKISDEYTGISKANVACTSQDFYSGSDSEKYEKHPVSLSNTNLK